MLPGAPPGSGFAAAVRRRVRADLGRVRGQRDAGQPPQRRRLPRLRDAPARVHRDVHARGHVVGAPPAVAPHVRGRVRASPEPALLQHRERHEVGARDAARARQLLRPHEVRPRLGGVLRRRGHEGHVAAPERVLAPPVSHRRELPAARSSATSATTWGSRTSCGASTTRTTKARSRTRGCTCGARSRACRPTRSSRWSR